MQINRLGGARYFEFGRGQVRIVLQNQLVGVNTIQFSAAQAAQKGRIVTSKYDMMFSAAQAAQKFLRRFAAQVGEFSAAQAAQKTPARPPARWLAFSAAQAAQKLNQPGAGDFLAVLCRTGSSENERHHHCR